MDHWAHLYEDTDALTQGWLRHAAKLLNDCTAAAEAAPAAGRPAAAAGQPPRSVLNVLVSSGQLVATLGKLLLFRLNSYFPIHSTQTALTSAAITAESQRSCDMCSAGARKLQIYAVFLYTLTGADCCIIMLTSQAHLTFGPA